MIETSRDGLRHTCSYFHDTGRGWFVSGKRRRARSQSKNTFIYITWITSAIKNLLRRATVLIGLALTSEATSPVPAPSSHTISSLKFQIVHSESQLYILFFVCLFVNNIKIDPNCRSRRPESADPRGGWISSVTPAAAVGSDVLVVFSGSDIWPPLAAAAGGRSSSMFPLEVSVLKKLMKKCPTVLSTPR